MSKYRKKPVEIEAKQFDGSVESANRILGWIGSNGRDARRAHPARPEAGIIITTLEGEMTAAAGDWVIQGVQGEFYPCKPDIFAATYDRPTVAPLDAIEPLTTERVQAAMDALGVSIPLLEMRSLLLDADGMTVVALAKDAQGKTKISGNSLATYTVTVPWEAWLDLRADQGTSRG